MLPLRIAACLFIVVQAGNAAAESNKSVAGDVFKTPTCGCCVKWADYMAANGFELKPRDMPTGVLMRFKTDRGVKPEQAACHTAMIDGYVIEGHVPADDVKRLLAEKPDAIGLTVPDMPVGSPGMEVGDTKEPYDVLLMKKDGTTEVYSKH